MEPLRKELLPPVMYGNDSNMEVFSSGGRMPADAARGSWWRIVWRVCCVAGGWSDLGGGGWSYDVVDLF